MIAVVYDHAARGSFTEGGVDLDPEAARRMHGIRDVGAGTMRIPEGHECSEADAAGTKLKPCWVASTERPGVILVPRSRLPG